MEHEPTLKYAVCRMLTYNLESVLEIAMYIDTDEKQSTPSVRTRPESNRISLPDMNHNGC
jgi:hypothetical protein